MLTEAVDALVRAATAKGEQLQIKLNESSPNPIGPGVVDFFTLEDGGTPVPGVYRIITPAMLQTPSGPQRLRLPIIFSAESVLWIAEGPLNDDEEPSVIMPGNGRRGGLHIGT